MMNIKTEFGIGAKVFFLQNNTLYYKEISEIKISVRIVAGTVISYVFHVLEYHGCEDTEKFESELALSKEELIAKLTVNY